MQYGRELAFLSLQQISLFIKAIHETKKTDDGMESEIQETIKKIMHTKDMVAPAVIILFKDAHSCAVYDESGHCSVHGANPE